MILTEPQRGGIACLTGDGLGDPGSLDDLFGQAGLPQVDQRLLAGVTLYQALFGVEAPQDDRAGVPWVVMQKLSHIRRRSHTRAQALADALMNRPDLRLKEREKAGKGEGVATNLLRAEAGGSGGLASWTFQLQSARSIIKPLISEVTGQGTRLLASRRLRSVFLYIC